MANKVKIILLCHSRSRWKFASVFHLTSMSQMVQHHPFCSSLCWLCVSVGSRVSGVGGAASRQTGCGSGDSAVPQRVCWQCHQDRLRHWYWFSTVLCFSSRSSAESQMDESSNPDSLWGVCNCVMMKTYMVFSSPCNLQTAIYVCLKYEDFSLVTKTIVLAWRVISQNWEQWKNFWALCYKHSAISK